MLGHALILAPFIDWLLSASAPGLFSRTYPLFRSEAGRAGLNAFYALAGLQALAALAFLLVALVRRRHRWAAIIAAITGTGWVVVHYASGFGALEAAVVRATTEIPSDVVRRFLAWNVAVHYVHAAALTVALGALLSVPLLARQGRESSMALRCVLLAAWLAVSSPASAQEIVSLTPRPAVTQSYFLARVPKDPQAIALLFPGGGGFIRLRSEDDRIKFAPGNFLVKTRGEFVKRGIVTAVLDAPSDQQGGWGMTDEFRFGDEHLTDVRAVLADLGRRFPDLPIFLVGTSRGSVSVASLGARIDRGVAGVVLTSTMYRATGPRSREPGPGLSRFDFGRLRSSMLLVHHRDDACPASPYADAAALAKRFPLVSVKGGLPPTSDRCEPMSPHGFFGREPETIEAIVNWMLKRPYATEIGGSSGG
jgi:hypothetical protein